MTATTRWLRVTGVDQPVVHVETVGVEDRAAGPEPLVHHLERIYHGDCDAPDHEHGLDDRDRGLGRLDQRDPDQETQQRGARVA